MAYWLFSSSLELKPTSALGPFFHSILNMFDCQDPALLASRFAFLETRFAIMAENGGYWRNFSFDVSFLERITHEDPVMLAESITHTERDFFLRLTPGDFEETEVKTLRCHLDATRSSTLANDIISCFAANGLLLRHIIQLVKVSWLLSAWLFITKHVSSSICISCETTTLKQLFSPPFKRRKSFLQIYQYSLE